MMIHPQKYWADWPFNTPLNEMLNRSVVSVVDIITLQCDILALVWLFSPANVTFWTCQCHFLALRLFPAGGTLPRELKNL